mmetsp:Transcript_41245/g.71376  ORF Transcript_41245/g.71376 Transcript_41245/m.71376 type:complete len:266 (+) Transcript_41245:58-855(+)
MTVEGAGEGYAGFTDACAARSGVHFNNDDNLGVRLHLTLLDPEVPRPLAAELEQEAEGIEVAQVQCSRFTAFFAQVVITSLILLVILPATRVVGLVILILTVIVLGASRIIFHLRSRRRMKFLCAQAERWVRPVRIIDPGEIDFTSAGDCAICLQGLADWTGLETESEVIDILQLKCGHLFHSKCLASWFNVMIVCPVCRSRGWGASRLRIAPNTQNPDPRYDSESFTGVSSTGSQEETGLASMSKSLLQEATVDQATVSSTGNH